MDDSSLFCYNLFVSNIRRDDTNLVRIHITALDRKTSSKFVFLLSEDGPQYLVTYKGTTHTGYLAMCAAINRSLGSLIILINMFTGTPFESKQESNADSGVRLTSPEVFKDIETSQLDELLMGDDGVSIPLLQDRVNCLHQVDLMLLLISIDMVDVGSLSVFTEYFPGVWIDIQLHYHGLDE